MGSSRPSCCPSRGSCRAESPPRRPRSLLRRKPESGWKRSRLSPVARVKAKTYPKMKKALPWIIALVVIAGGCFGWWRWHVKHASVGPTYKTAPVEKRRITGKVTASGTLSALVTVQVGTQVSGRIQKLFADFNSEVKKGELVAKIDPQLFEAAEQQAQANYLQAKAGVASANAAAMAADKTFARTKALKDQNLAAQADMDTAEAAVATTHAQIDAANAGLAQAA